MMGTRYIIRRQNLGHTDGDPWIKPKPSKMNATLGEIKLHTQTHTLRDRQYGFCSFLDLDLAQAHVGKKKKKAKDKRCYPGNP